jgi:hypothetical protein
VEIEIRQDPFKGNLALYGEKIFFNHAECVIIFGEHTMINKEFLKDCGTQVKGYIREWLSGKIDSAVFFVLSALDGIRSAIPEEDFTLRAKSALTVAFESIHSKKQLSAKEEQAAKNVLAEIKDAYNQGKWDDLEQAAAKIMELK